MLDPDFLLLCVKTQKRIIELQHSLIWVLKNKPDNTKSIKSHEETIRELMGLLNK